MNCGYREYPHTPVPTPGQSTSDGRRCNLPDLQKITSETSNKPADTAHQLIRQKKKKLLTILNYGKSVYCARDALPPLTLITTKK